jgi:predicted transcriptional regulator
MATRVGDIMTTEVLKAKLHWTSQELATFFIEKKVTGAPVVDLKDELVGVVTVTDLVKVAGYSGEDEVAKVQAYYEAFLGQALSLGETQQIMDAAKSSFSVESLMTRSVIRVEKHTDIRQVSRLMVDEKVHRIFVTERMLDAEKLVGIVSTMDILDWYSKQSDD